MKTTQNNQINISKLKKEVKAKKQSDFSKRAIDWMSNIVKGYVFPFIQVVFALCALIIILGLAYKGALTYLSQMSDTQRSIAALVAVAILGYCTATGLKRILK